MTSPDLLERLTRNSSELLGLLALAGTAAALIRWKAARRPDIMFAFGIFLVGTAMREVPIYLGGMTGPWTTDLIMLSGLARAAQVTGCVLFIRATFRDICPAWGWVTITGVMLLLAWII